MNGSEYVHFMVQNMFGLKDNLILFYQLQVNDISKC